MDEWTRLTPEGCTSYRRTDDDVFVYEFSIRHLTSADALAFAAQLPEVKALVEAVDLLLAEAVEQNECVEDVPVELWDRVTSSLAAIQEAK